MGDVEDYLQAVKKKPYPSVRKLARKNGDKDHIVHTQHQFQCDQGKECDPSCRFCNPIKM